MHEMKSAQQIRPQERHVVVVSQDVRDYGGVSSHVWSVVDAIEELGYSTELATIATSWRDSVSLKVLSPKSWWSSIRSVQVNTSGVNRSWTHYGGRFVEFGWLRYEPRELLTARLEKADLVVVVCGTAQFAAVARNVGVPIVICAATTLDDERGASALSSKRWKRYLIALWSLRDRQLEKAALSSCVALVAQSQISAKLLEKLCNRPVIVAPMGYRDPQVFDPMGHSARGRTHLLSVGRIDDPRKRVDVLLFAYHLVRARNPTAPNLIIATGSSPTEATLKQIQALGLAPYVKIEVGISDERLQDLYAHAFALLHTADQEGLGLIVLEAMAAGIPVVCTRCGGPEDILREGIDGLLVERDKPEAVCQATLWILSNSEAAERMGRSGAMRVRNEWHPRVGRQVFQSTLKQVLGDSVGGATTSDR